MPDPLYALTATDVSALREIVSAYRSGDLGRPIEANWKWQKYRSVVVFGILDGAAAATTALIGPPKSATLKVYNMTSTGGTTYSGRDETVYNFAPQAATTDRWTFCVRDHYSGNWLIDYQACS